MKERWRKKGEYGRGKVRMVKESTGEEKERRKERDREAVEE